MITQLNVGHGPPQAFLAHALRNTQQTLEGVSLSQDAKAVEHHMETWACGVTINVEVPNIDKETLNGIASVHGRMPTKPVASLVQRLLLSSN